MAEMRNVAKYSVIVTGLLILSKLSGFVYDFILAALFGATRDADIFRTSLQIPNSLFSAMAAALITSFIPVFANVKMDKDKAHEFFNNILNILLIICTFLAILGMTFAPFLTKLFAKGFEADVFNRTVQMTRIVMPSIIFLGISGLYAGYLQSYGTFIQPAVTGITTNVIIILGLLLFHNYGIIAAVVSFFIGSIAQVLVQRPFMKNYKYKPIINLRDDNVRKMLVLAVPTIISTAVSQISPMVTNSFASSVEGNIAVLSYANKFSTIINQVFIISITTILYPNLTEKYAFGEMDEFRSTVKRSINIVIIVAVPLVFGLASLSLPLVKVLLERGKFTSEDANLTAICLRYLAFGALGYSLMDILSKVYYSTKDTLTTMINGFITVGTTVAYINIFGPSMGVSGLALSQVLAVATSVVILFIRLIFKIKGIAYKNIVLTLLKTLFSGGIMSLVVIFSYGLLENLLGQGKGGMLIGIFVSTIMGAGTYLGIMYLLKIDEFKTVINMTFGRLLKKAGLN